MPKGNPLARTKKLRSHEQKHSCSLRPVILVFILSPLSDSLSHRDERYIHGKMSSRPFQRCIDCRDAFMFHRVTIVCTLVYALQCNVRTTTSTRTRYLVLGQSRGGLSVGRVISSLALKGLITNGHSELPWPQP